jgi:hypothetical protein
MKFEIHFEFRASLRKFQDLNFWDATMSHLRRRTLINGEMMKIKTRKMIKKLEIKDCHIVISWPLGWDILAQGLIELIE